MTEVKEKIRNNETVRAVERDQFIALALMVAAAAATGHTGWIAGLLAGGVLMAANFRLLRNVVMAFIFRQLGEGGATTASLLAQVAFKFALLGGAIFLILWSRQVDPIAFVVGTTALLLSIAWQAAKTMLVAPPVTAGKGAE